MRWIKKKKEELYKFIQVHHLWTGEGVSFNCPHCTKDIAVELKTLELDSDTIEVYWGKSIEEIEEKKKRVEKELQEET